MSPLFVLLIGLFWVQVSTMVVVRGRVAAVQNVLLSLHAEGIGSKWATGPVVRTPAFRQLVQAAPTDRVAALIMVGGMESTHFCSDRERDRTTARRHRRRSIDGDLLVDLP